jgi:hypothetical protein
VLGKAAQTVFWLYVDPLDRYYYTDYHDRATPPNEVYLGRN